jgi:hypothetical protein
MNGNVENDSSLLSRGEAITLNLHKCPKPDQTNIIFLSGHDFDIYSHDAGVVVGWSVFYIGEKNNFYSEHAQSY